MTKTIVIAVGGNALPAITPQDTSALEETLAPIIDFAEQGMRIVVTYGNGPQVGIIYESLVEGVRNHDLATDILMASTGAMSVGSVGSLIRFALRNICMKRQEFFKITAIVAHTRVDLDDPAFQSPTKPVGRFLSLEEAEVMRSAGKVIIEDSGRGYRWVVPSPKPIEVLEVGSVKALLDAGHIVLTCGGGGIPTVSYGTHQSSVEAVIDKDAASALLAYELQADSLLLLTGVEKVAVDFGKPSQRWISHMTCDEAFQYISEGQFPPGSMLPKIEAAVEFVGNNPAGEALITSIDCLGAALQGKTGTRITA